MSEKAFLDMGAEVVGGNMLLKRVVVGVYRDDMFSVTKEGSDMLKAEPIEVQAVEVAPAEEPVPKKTKAKAKPDTESAQDLLDAIPDLG